MEHTQLLRDEQSEPFLALDEYSSDSIIICLLRIFSVLRDRDEKRYDEFCTTMIYQLQELAPKPNSDNRNMDLVLMEYLDSTIDIQGEETGKAMKVTGRLTTYKPGKDTYVLTIRLQDGSKVKISICLQEYWEGIISIEHHDDLLPGTPISQVSDSHIAAKQSPDIQQLVPTFLTNGTVFLPLQLNKMMGFPAGESLLYTEAVTRINKFIHDGGKSEILAKAYQDMKKALAAQALTLQSLGWLGEGVELREGSRIKVQGILWETRPTTDGFVSLRIGGEGLQKLLLSRFLDGTYHMVLSPKGNSVAEGR